MKKKRKLLITTACGAMLALSGCATYKSASIMQADNAQVAVTLNSDFSTTVIAATAGSRVPTCEIDRKLYNENPKAALARCVPDGHVPSEVVFEETYNVKVLKGSVCISVASGSHVYVFCDPPVDLGF